MRSAVGKPAVADRLERALDAADEGLYDATAEAVSQTGPIA